MAGVHLAIRVQQLLLGQPDAEGGLYCVLSTGSTRFSTSKASAAAEVFIISPWELSHATKKPLPASPSTQNDHIKPLTSPVLTVELYSAKRWGADAVIASGEVLLGPLLEQLQANGSGASVTVVLARAGSKPGGSKAAAAASSLADDTVVLQLSTVTAPAVPQQLLGPVGSGRGEVPPRFCADASWLTWRQPVLHTGAGHLYQAPTVQLLRVTLHKAQGLQNLHVDPMAAAAAASAMGRLAAVGSSPSRADRAKAAAERAMLDGGKVGRNLLQQTSTWFKRSKSSAAVSTAPAAGARASSVLGPSRPGLPHTQSAVVGSSPPGTTAPAAWFPATSAVGGRAGVAGGADAAAPADAVTNASMGVDAEAEAGVEAADAAGQQIGRSSSDGPARTLKHSLSGSSNASGSGSASGSGQSASPLAANPLHGAGALPAAEQAVEQALEGAQQAATQAVQRAEEAAEDTVSSLVHDVGQSPGSLADPVSLLKQATQHKRNSSVDAEAVMAALEENGFHATDAYMGAFFYARLTLVGTGDAGSSGSAGSGSAGGSSSYCSKVVALSLAGEASWDQGFWLPLVRPAPAGAGLELELYAAKDEKTRGKLVASVKAPLQQLLPLEQPQAGGLPWARASHVLQASFSDHLHCSFSLTVEVADWDLRAQLAGIPRTLSAAAAAAAAELSSQSLSVRAGTATAAAAAGEASAGVGGPAVGSSSAGSPRVARQRSDGTSLQAAAAEATAAAGGGASASAGAAAGVPAEMAAVGALGSSVQQPPPVAVLDLVVKAFDTHRPLDVFFVLLLGPYCLVSSTSHSTQHHHWGWHLKLPLAEPAETLTLALLAREDQAGGRKRVGAPLLTMFSASVKLVGKLRIRLSTLPANTPLNLSMPLQGERSNLRAGQPTAATAHLYLNMAVPQLLGRYLPAYASFTVCSPALYLLANAPGVVGPDSTLEALAKEVAATTARWVEQQPPMLPAKVFRKVQDDGRAEFTLSRTRANWRRLTLLRDATAPARQLFSHLCSWSNPWHSGGWYGVILLFGVFPSRVLSVLLLLLAVALVRKLGKAQVTPAAAGSSAAVAAAAAAGAATAAAAAAAKQGAKPGAGSGSPGATAAAAAATGAAMGAVVVAGGGGGSSRSWRLLPVQPPPVMWDPSYALPEDAAQQASAVPTDPYTSLKQNYEAVIAFLTLVQRVIDDWASAGERLQLAFSWTDPLATGVLLVLMLLLALGLWVVGLQVLVTVGLLWVFRHPILRTPLPPPPVNFVWSLPTRADTML